MTNPELLAHVRAYLRVQAPGLFPSSISIAFHNSAIPLTLPVGLDVGTVAGPAPQAAQAAQTQPAGIQEERGPALRGCVKAILETLRQSSRPLSKTLLLEAMGKRGFEYSESTVCRYLAVLMEDGTIENPESARPRGYRLATEEGG